MPSGGQRTTVGARPGSSSSPRSTALLAGNPGSRLAVPLDDVAGVDYALGRLRLSRRRGAPICIGSLDAPGALLELADALRAGCALSGV
jgi:hypothetical protein